MPNDLLGENILKKTKVGYISATQFSSSVTCPTNVNLFERNGTNKVLDKEKDGDKTTIPAHVTGYVTPLAFTISIHLGWVTSIKSSKLNVI